MKTRGLESAPGVKDRLKQAEAAVQDVVFTEKLKDFPRLFGFNAEDFFLTSDREDLNQSDYMSNP